MRALQAEAALGKLQSSLLAERARTKTIEEQLLLAKQMVAATEVQTEEPPPKPTSFLARFACFSED